MPLKKIFVFLLMSLFVMTSNFEVNAQEQIKQDTPLDLLRVNLDLLPTPPDKLPGEADIGPAISPMKWGQKAPFTGLLLSPEAVASIIAELSSFDERIALELERNTKVQAAQCDFKIEQIKIVLNADKKILQAQVDARNKDIELLNNRLKESEDSAPNMALWVGGSFMVGVAVTVLTTVAISYAIGAGNQ